MSSFALLATSALALFRLLRRPVIVALIFSVASTPEKAVLVEVQCKANDHSHESADDHPDPGKVISDGFWIGDDLIITSEEVTRKVRLTRTTSDSTTISRPLFWFLRRTTGVSVSPPLLDIVLSVTANNGANCNGAS